jgi:AcrR family transcriptional regulator
MRASQREKSSSGPGRPRSERAHRAILGAALELVAEQGLSALTMESVAARAGVGKATIYRRWPSKLPLVMEALGELPPLQPSDTGSLRRDLVEMLRGFLRLLRSTPLVPVLLSLSAEASRDPTLARQLRAHFARRREPIAAALQRAIGRGELPRELDPELAADLLVGPLLTRVCFTGGRLDAPALRRLVDAALDGVAAAGARDGRSARRRAQSRP